jgi:hypothetical protein
MTDFGSTKKPEHSRRFATHALPQRVPTVDAVLDSEIAIFPQIKTLRLQVGPNLARLHIDTVVVGQKEMTFPVEGGGVSGDAGPVLLSGGDGSPSGGSVQAYAHFVRLLRQPEITQHYVKVNRLLQVVTMLLGVQVMLVLACSHYDQSLRQLKIAQLTSRCISPSF